MIDEDIIAHAILFFGARKYWAREMYLIEQMYGSVVKSLPVVASSKSVAQFFRLKRVMMLFGNPIVLCFYFPFLNSPEDWIVYHRGIPLRTGLLIHIVIYKRGRLYFDGFFIQCWFWPKSICGVSHSLYLVGEYAYTGVGHCRTHLILQRHFVDVFDVFDVDVLHSFFWFLRTIPRFHDQLYWVPTD